MQHPAASLAVFLLSMPALAQGSQPAPSPAGGFAGILPMMIVMFAIIYFLMIRPEQKKQKTRQKMIDEIKKGDRVLTIGGIIGTVGNIKDGTVMVKIAENTVVELRKGAVSEVLIDKTEKPAEKK